MAKKEKAYLDPQESSNKGLLGAFEVTIRRFKLVSHALTLLPCYLLGSICMGLAATPGISLLVTVWNATTTLAAPLHFAATGIATAAGYFLYGFSLLFIIPAVNFILRVRIRPWRGPYYSAPAVKWYVHNALTYLMRYTFLEFLTPTPFNVLFYRLMGMKIGEGTQINTTNISDPSLIEIGEKVTVGGSATIIAHYGMSGLLVIAPVKIGSRAVIGLHAIIMGDVEIGDGAKVLANSVVLPKSRIPAGETWGGVPARKIEIMAKDSDSQKKWA
jgi:hypothetical protein